MLERRKYIIRKDRKWFLPPALLAAAFLLGLLIFRIFVPQEVARVNGEGITEEELLLLDAVYGFQIAAGQTEGSCSDALMDAAIELKVELCLYREDGLLKDVSYAGFRRTLREENNRRAAALKNGEVIYGPESFDEAAFFLYWRGALRSQWLRLLADEGRLFAEEEIGEYYDAHPELFRNVDSIHIQKLIIPCSGGGADETREKIEALAAQINSPEDFAACYAQNQQEYSDAGIAFEEEFNADTYRTDLRTLSPIYLAAAEMQEGELSGIVNAGSYYALLFCSSRTPGEATALDEVRGNIADLLTQERYGDYVQKARSEAEIQIFRARLRAVEKKLEK